MRQRLILFWQLAEVIVSNPPQNNPEKEKKRTFWIAVVALFFVVVLLLWFIYWLFIGRFYVYTDDAYVHGNEVMLTPQVAASISAIYADETDLVQQGQLLIQLDPSDYQIVLEEAIKRFEEQVREVAWLFQDVEAKKAAVELARAKRDQSQLNFQHREPLVETGAVSVEEFENFRAYMLVDEAGYAYAQEEWLGALALVEGTTVATHPRVLEAMWQLKQAYLNLIRCQIQAPVTGYIAKRSAQVGDQVTPGQTLLYIVPLNQIWLEANYKETHLTRVRIGQPVSFTADIYGRSIRYSGKVIGFQPGSGNAFALLPPQNASGNWIKIIQRVPVRIGIDCDTLEQYPLLLGLSMRVTVDVHDTEGKMLASQPTLCPLYTTPIFTEQFEQLASLDTMIEELIDKNWRPQ